MVGADDISCGSNLQLINYLWVTNWVCFTTSLAIVITISYTILQCTGNQDYKYKNNDYLYKKLYEYSNIQIFITLCQSMTSIRTNIKIYLYQTWYGRYKYLKFQILVTLCQSMLLIQMNIKHIYKGDTNTFKYSSHSDLRSQKCPATHGHCCL